MLDRLLTQPGVEERSILRSHFGFCALHGGLEQHTAEIAQRAAETAGASFYGVVQPDDLRWHVPSRHYDPALSPVLAGFLGHVETLISVHGYGGLANSDERWTTALLGGPNRALAHDLAEVLRDVLPQYTWLDDLARIPTHLRGVHRDNPVGLPPSGGVQIELPPRVRGFGPYWSDFDGPGFPPHTESLISALARVAEREPPALLR